VGRISIIEIMPMSDALRSLIMRHATATDLRRQVLADGMLTMYDHGLRKVVQGVTTFEEVLRVTREA
jgi:general secretion pathway protein E